MAVKASAQVTIYYVVDVKATYRYYLLQSSTLSTPSKPTTYPPASTWDDTEPSYVDGSTKTLYFVDCTLFNNGTFVYSEVSKSSSYEAAKSAYNKAVNAQNLIDNLEIGGRNLIRNSTDMIFENYYFYEPGESIPVTAAWDDDGNITVSRATTIHDEEGNITLSYRNGDISIDGAVEMRTLTVNGVTFEVVDAEARSEITKLLLNNPVSSKISEVTLAANMWVGDASPYSQIVNIVGVTENSQVDLTPSVQQLAVFHEKDLGFVTENEGGVVTVYAIGQRPQNDYTIQVTITEVDYD